MAKPTHTNALTEYAYEIWQLLSISSIAPGAKYNLVATVNNTANVNGLVLGSKPLSFPSESLGYTIPEWTAQKLEIMLNSLLTTNSYSNVVLSPEGSYHIYLKNVTQNDYYLDIGTDTIPFNIIETS